VTRVVMEATSAYVKPPFYLLEDDIAECWVVNARDVDIPASSKPAVARWSSPDQRLTGG
jgi:transposase